jgi:hypothetical protein
LIADDDTDATEDGSIEMWGYVNGTNQVRMRIGATAFLNGSLTISNDLTVAGTMIAGTTNFWASSMYSGTVPSTVGVIMFGTNVFYSSRLPLVSKDSATLLAVETGSATGTEVVTYTTAFSANPLVFLTPSGTAGLITNYYPICTNPRTNFTTVLAGAATFNWMAVGAK